MRLDRMGGDRTARKLSRVIVGAVSGSLCYCVLYLGYSFLKLILVGSAPEAAAIAMVTKLAATLTNAIVADVMRCRSSLPSAKLWSGRICLLAVRAGHKMLNDLE